MWRVIKGMYDCTRSATLLDGEHSQVFDIHQGVAQGCSLLPILFSGLLKEVEKTELGIEMDNGGKIGGFFLPMTL